MLFLTKCFRGGRSQPNMLDRYKIATAIYKYIHSIYKKTRRRRPSQTQRRPAQPGGLYTKKTRRRRPSQTQRRPAQTQTQRRRAGHGSGPGRAAASSFLHVANSFEYISCHNFWFLTTPSTPT